MPSKFVFSIRLFALSALFVVQPAKADAFMSMMDSANYSGVQFAGTLMINSTLRSGKSGPTQAQLDADTAYHKQRSECMRAAIQNTPSATPARDNAKKSCDRQYPLKQITDFTADGKMKSSSKAPSASVKKATASNSATAYSGAYRPTAQVLSEVQNGFYNALKPVSKSTAEEVRTKLFSHDVEKLFGDTVRPFGLKSGDSIDSTTAYLVSMWVIANQAPNPTPRQVAGARQQIGQMLADNGKLNGTAADKQRMSQRMMYETILGLVAFNDPKIDKAQLAEATSRNLKRGGLDLKRLSLTNAGFATR
jgi:hypothetical protein